MLGFCSSSLVRGCTLVRGVLDTVAAALNTCCHGLISSVLLQCLHRLLAIGDSMGMGLESARMVSFAYCSILPGQVLIALASRGTIPVDIRIHLCYVVCYIYTLFDINVLSRRFWGEQRSRRNINPRAVAVMSSTVFSKSDSLRCVSDMPGPLVMTKLNKTLLLLKSPPLKTAYAQFVEKALCFESYKFLVDAVTYAGTSFQAPSEQVLLITSLSICAQCS
jgi:hypothetical protein